MSGQHGIHDDSLCAVKSHSNDRKMGLSVAEYEYQKSLLEHGLHTATNIQHYLKNYQDPLREPPEIETKVQKADYEEALNKIRVLESKLERRDELIVELRRETALRLVGIRSGKVDEVRARVRNHAKTDELRVLDLENELALLEARFQDQCAETNLIKSKLADEFDRFKQKNDEFSKFVFSSQEQYKLVLKDKIVSEFALEHEKEAHAMTNNALVHMRKELANEKDNSNRLKKRINELVAKQVDVDLPTHTEVVEDFTSEIEYLQLENQRKDKKLREASKLVEKYKAKHDKLVEQLDEVVNTMMPIHIANRKSPVEPSQLEMLSCSSHSSDDGKYFKRKKKHDRNMRHKNKSDPDKVALMPQTITVIHAISEEDEVESDYSSSSTSSSDSEDDEESSVEEPTIASNVVQNTSMTYHKQGDTKVTKCSKKRSVANVSNSGKKKVSPLPILETLEEIEDSDLSIPNSPAPEAISPRMTLSPGDINKIAQIELKLYDAQSENEKLLAQIDTLEAHKDEADLRNIELSELFEDTRNRLENEISMLKEQLENKSDSPAVVQNAIPEYVSDEEAENEQDSISADTLATAPVNRELLSPMSMQPTTHLEAHQIPPPCANEKSLSTDQVALTPVNDSISCVTMNIDNLCDSISISASVGVSLAIAPEGTTEQPLLLEEDDQREQGEEVESNIENDNSLLSGDMDSQVLEKLDQGVQTVEDCAEMQLPVGLEERSKLDICHSVGTNTKHVSLRNTGTMTNRTATFSVDKFLTSMSRDYQLLSRKQVPYMDFSKVAPMTQPSRHFKYDQDGRLIPSFVGVRPLISTHGLDANDLYSTNASGRVGHRRAEDDCSKRALNMRRRHVHQTLLKKTTRKQTFDELERRLKSCLSYIEACADLRNKYILNIPTNADTVQSRNVVRSIDLILQTIGHYLSPYGLHSDDEYPELCNYLNNEKQKVESDKLALQESPLKDDNLTVSGHNTHTFELTQEHDGSPDTIDRQLNQSQSPWFLNNSLTLREREAFMKNLYTKFDDSEIIDLTGPVSSVAVDGCDPEEASLGQSEHMSSSYHHVDFDLSRESMEQLSMYLNLDNKHASEKEQMECKNDIECTGNGRGMNICIKNNINGRPVSAPSAVSCVSKNEKPVSAINEVIEPNLFSIRKIIGVNDTSSRAHAINMGYIGVNGLSNMKNTERRQQHAFKFNQNHTTGSIKSKNTGKNGCAVSLNNDVLHYTYNGEDISMALATTGDSMATVFEDNSKDAVICNTHNLAGTPNGKHSVRNHNMNKFNEGIIHGKHEPKPPLKTEEKYRTELSVKPNITDKDVDDSGEVTNTVVKKATLHETYKVLEHDSLNAMKMDTNMVEEAKLTAQTYYSNMQGRHLYATPHSINNSIDYGGFDFDTISMELNKNVDQTAAHTVTTPGAMLITAETPISKPPCYPAPSVINHNIYLKVSPVLPSTGTSRNMLSHKKLNSRDNSPASMHLHEQSKASHQLPVRPPSNQSPKRPATASTLPLPNRSTNSKIDVTKEIPDSTISCDQEEQCHSSTNFGDAMTKRPVSASGSRTVSNSKHNGSRNSTTHHISVTRPKTSVEASILNVVSPQRPKSSAPLHNRIPHKKA